MTEADRAEFAGALVLVAEMFNRELSPAAMELYWRGLVDIGLEDVRAGLDAAVKVSRFMPTVAAVREASRSARYRRVLEEGPRDLGDVDDAIADASRRALASGRVRRLEAPKGAE